MTGHAPGRPRRPASRAWMVTFADLLSLLLAFFVLLFAMSSVETNAWKTLVDALSSRLNPLHHWIRPLVDPEKTAPRLFVKRAIDLDYLAGVLQAGLADSDILSQSILHRLDDALVLSLPGHLIFLPGQARLHADSQQALVVLAPVLKLVGNSIELVGHTNASPPPAGSPFGSNWDLSLARAVALANGLRAVGYTDAIKVLGAADAGYRDMSLKLSAAQREILSRRVDLVIRETSAGGGANAP
ncbi:MAG: OmpA family protein [Proteobacteria bacterium]|nr:OmpA family protein [Pseudomonadota bacterium]